MRIEISENFRITTSDDENDNKKVKDMFFNAVRKNEGKFKQNNKNHNVPEEHAKRLYDRDTSKKRKTSMNYNFGGKIGRSKLINVESLEVEKSK